LLFYVINIKSQCLLYIYGLIVVQSGKLMFGAYVKAVYKLRQRVDKSQTILQNFL